MSTIRKSAKINVKGSFVNYVMLYFKWDITFADITIHDKRGFLIGKNERIS